jgi:hypothetical protein
MAATSRILLKRVVREASVGGGGLAMKIDLAAHALRTAFQTVDDVLRS